ncbi:MAG: Stp1/IreP family PP2C-type Ser/Thr phosphatase [Clostridiales bacterium]|jgi:protein phosphatase|nr:Stp1/IreP family PP2C-type Ser/Thr phosphatase [Clostridiales bacterium]
MQSSGKSHVGKVRTQNQDAILISEVGPAPLPNLFIAADGLGGHSSGDIASNRAMAAFCAFFENAGHAESLEDLLAGALAFANLQVHEDSLNNQEHQGMGTTFTACSIHKKMIHYVHVGDSRIYLVKNDAENSLQLVQLTKDHFSLTADMVAAGLLTEEEAKGYPEAVLTRAIGTDSDVKIDKGAASLEGVVYILLCTDGLTNMIDDNEIANIIKSTKSLDEAAETLVNAALDAGGRDNISVILIGWGEE